MQPRLIKNIILGILFFIIGFYSSILIKKWTVLTINEEINFEINPFEILTLSITIFLAIYVTRILSKKNDLEKNEKELLINYLTEFKNLTNNKINYILSKDNFDTPETKSDLKIIRKKINTILTLASEYNFITDTESLSTDLNNKVRDIWELLTDCPEKVTGRANSVVKNGIERIRLEQVNKVEVGLIDIEKIIFKLTMKINKK